MNIVDSGTAVTVAELGASTVSAWQLIDVRSPTEFAAGHIPTAVNIPMDEIECRVCDLRLDMRTLLVCQSGKRAAITHDLLAPHQAGLAVLTGGTDAWRDAGHPLVASTRSRWALERQVRLVAGVLVLVGVLLGLAVNRAWFGVAAFAGAGLMLAGTTNFCAMANLLALMPWNRRGSSVLRMGQSGPILGSKSGTP